ncbi:Uncharacterised protein [Burkholderia pseudomallei]|nr:Uncharacterised protein [Burkholderia pseudomallei]VBG46167.1 Uncharacterised protein [Burkholderia pseudomallei]VBJ88214.1 Uncharacterised protein [Burkholderia pseudomallei]
MAEDRIIGGEFGGELAQVVAQRRQCVERTVPEAAAPPRQLDEPDFDMRRKRGGPSKIVRRGAACVMEHQQPVPRVFAPVGNGEGAGQQGHARSLQCQGRQVFGRSGGAANARGAGRGAMPAEGPDIVARTILRFACDSGCRFAARMRGCGEAGASRGCAGFRARRAEGRAPSAGRPPRAAASRARRSRGDGPWSKTGARSCSRAPVLVSRALAGEPRRFAGRALRSVRRSP